MPTTSLFGRDRRWGGVPLRAACALLVSAALIVACGIPQLPILEPPGLGTVTQLPAVVTFTHDPLNDTENFRGYDLYYKFYDPADAGSGGVEALIRADALAIENAAPSNIPNAATVRGFNRVFTTQFEDSPPAILIAPGSRGSQFTVTVSFPDSAAAGDAVATWEGNQQILVRNQDILGNPSDLLGFGASDLIPGTHPDLPPTLESTELDMALMVVSFGVDFTSGTFARIYSGAVATEQPLRIIYE